MLVSPVQAGSTWWVFSGAAEALPCKRKIAARTTSSRPGISVPMKIPYDASRPVERTPRAETSTAAQNRTMITALV